MGRLGTARPPNRPILTPRQLEVLEQVAGGMTNSEIRHELRLQPTTVKVDWQEPMHRLGVRPRRGDDQGLL